MDDTIQFDKESGIFTCARLFVQNNRPVVQVFCVKKSSGQTLQSTKENRHVEDYAEHKKMKEKFVVLTNAMSDGAIATIVRAENGSVQLSVEKNNSARFQTSNPNVFSCLMRWMEFEKEQAKKPKTTNEQSL